MPDWNQPDFIRESDRIAGVQIADLRAFSDDRGRFMETFRLEWFPQVSWARLQANRSDSRAGVLRGLHYHFKQIDYWYVPFGRARACLVDLRPSSPTHRHTLTVEMGDGHNVGLFIPEGVAHGFAALTDCTVTYIVNNYYDGADEFGVAWNDPAIGLDWGVAEPIISGRDAANPLLQNIAPEHLPR